MLATVSKLSPDVGNFTRTGTGLVRTGTVPAVFAACGMGMYSNFCMVNSPIVDCEVAAVAVGAVAAAALIRRMVYKSGEPIL